MSTEPTGRRIRQFDVTISEIVTETPDTVTLVMTGPERFEYKAGQFCTIDPHQFHVIGGMTRFLEDLKHHKEPPRAYSMASAPHEPLAITIKEELYEPGATKYPPLLSPVLVHSIPLHSRMIISGFTGPYTFPDNIAREDRSHRARGGRVGQRTELGDAEACGEIHSISCGIRSSTRTRRGTT